MGVPFALALLSSLACGESNKISVSRETAAIAALELSKEAARNMHDGALKIVGEKKTKDIEDRGIIDAANAVTTEEIESTGLGDQPWVDLATKRKFRIDPENMRQALVKFKTMIWANGYANLNDLYELIHLEPCQAGERLGVNVSSLKSYGINTFDDFLDLDIPRIRGTGDKDTLKSYMVIDWTMPFGESCLDPGYQDEWQ
jgi:hypothetical protein